MKSRNIEISFNNRTERIILPVNPATIDFTLNQQNQKVTLANVGEVNIFGNRALTAVTFSSFFPFRLSPFWRYADKEPTIYISALERWKLSQKPVRLIISDSSINLAMVIDSLVYNVKEGDKDIYYTLSLSEYRQLNVPAVKESSAVQANGLKPRPDAQVKPKTHTVKKGDTLWYIAKLYYGSGAQYTKIYNANKSIIGKNPNIIKVGMVLQIP